MRTEITISFDADSLTNYTDEHLVCLWAVTQANPAPQGCLEAGHAAERVAREIVRRFVDQVGLPLWSHQGSDAYCMALARHGKGKWLDGEYVPDGQTQGGNDVLCSDAL